MGFPSPLAARAAALTRTLQSATAPRFALARARAAIDALDDGLLVLLAARRRLVSAVAGLKQRAGMPARDPRREQAVRQRAKATARRLGVPPATATRLLDLAIADACAQQGLDVDLRQGEPDDAAVMLERMNPLTDLPAPLRCCACCRHLHALLPCCA